MGWLVSTDPSMDRKRLVQQILDDYRHPRRRQYPTLVDHSLRGNTLYMVVHVPTWRANGVRPATPLKERLADLTFDLRGNYRVILVYLLQGPRRGSGEGWGYKDMDESMGPNVVTCPERLLAQSQVDDRHGWREDCRRARREAKARKAWAKTVAPNARLEMFRGYRHDGDRPNQPVYEEVVFLRRYSPTFFVGRFASDTKQYRMRWSDILLPESAAV